MENCTTLSYSIQIDADRNKIWQILWNLKSYMEWTRVFTEGSYYKGELKQGNIIHFLGKDGGGMSSFVETMIEDEQMVFAHQKEVKDGIETGASWEGAKETYYLKSETEGSTDLQVIVDITSEMAGYFNEVFPQALQIIKQLSEN